MKTTKILSASIGALLGASFAARAAQPPDPVASDSLFNTAAGTAALVSETTGTLNTAIGYEALDRNTSGGNNTALGASALFGNTTGFGNTASGNYALHLNNANGNTAAGYYSMYYNSSGALNTADGYQALEHNTTGATNTALGAESLYSNTTGADNVASGIYSMYLNTTGNDNTAVGARSFYNNSGGVDNVAVGSSSLYGNTIGYLNVAVGYEAMYQNTNGGANVAVGQGALYANSTGSDNVAIGTGAGEDIVGSDNVDISAPGTNTDSGVIRIGTVGTQKSAFIAGVTNSKITGSAVYVNAAGRLGVLASSERYKTGIAAMGSRTQRLQQLRPVTFHLKTEPTAPVQYGLIAEEVERVYPELVTRDAAGVIQGVRYDELAPMLLNEVQLQQRKLAADDEALRDMRQQVAEIKQANTSMLSAIARLENDNQRIAMR
jgi:hypothetical protein